MWVFSGRVRAASCERVALSFVGFGFYPSGLFDFYLLHERLVGRVSLFPCTRL